MRLGGGLGAGGWRVFDGIGADGDVAGEDSAFFDDEFAGAQVAFVAGGLFEFDAVTGDEIAVDIAFDDDGAGLNIGLHFGFAGYVELAGGVDFAFKAALEAHGFFKGEFAFEGGVGAEDGGILRVGFCHGSCLLCKRVLLISGNDTGLGAIPKLDGV